jgi:hypothetical protein
MCVLFLDVAHFAKRSTHDTHQAFSANFSSYKGYALHDPAALFYNTTMDHRGWFTGHNGALLFWVPVDLRYIFFCPGNQMVLPRGVELDVSKMVHGEEWHKVKD